MPDRRVAPPSTEPPPHLLARTSYNGAIWYADGNGQWATRLPGGTTRAPWARIGAGQYGDVEILVPVPFTAGGYGSQTVVEHVLNPVAAMMQQLAAAAAAAVTAVVADAYRRGRAEAAPVGIRYAVPDDILRRHVDIDPATGGQAATFVLRPGSLPCDVRLDRVHVTDPPAEATGG